MSHRSRQDTVRYYDFVLIPHISIGSLPPYAPRQFANFRLEEPLQGWFFGMGIEESPPYIEFILDNLYARQNRRILE
jgi:hypothetical protein